MIATAADPQFAARAVARLSLIEFWERYSFFTVFALLALFASAPAARGGFGWGDADCLRFFGLYLLVVQASPIVGGFVADRWLGKRLALRFGAAALAIGHLLLATTAALPLLVQAAQGQPLSVAVAAARASFGHWSAPARLSGGLTASYLWVTGTFYAAVTLIAVGNGLFKPILSVVIGRLPFADQASRSSAFTTFFLYANIGGLLSILLGGWLSQRFGWSFAFGGSALGMLVSIATMIRLDRVYLRPFVGSADTEIRDGEHPRLALSFIAPILMLLGLVAVCASISYQSYGFVALFTSQLVARTVLGFAIPPAWFTALNPVTIMILTPLLLAFWRRGGFGARWTEVQRIAAGFIAMAIGFTPLVGAALQARGGHLASPLWVVAAIMVIASSEMLYSPAALSAATRLAPRTYQTLAVGSQGAATGIGGWLSGQIGALAFESDKALVMGCIAGLAFALGAILFASRRWFSRLDL